MTTTTPGTNRTSDPRTDVDTETDLVDEESPLDEGGVRIVGATGTPSPSDGAADAAPPRPPSRRSGGPGPVPSRRAFRMVALVAALGIIGTVVFGVLYATGSSAPPQNPAVNQAAQAFLTDFFNFNAKTVDADFTAVTNMATGPFATQAKQFFNSSIRQALEQALAESRGQTRALYVQSESANAATLYAVVDQTYVNNKITTPQADVVRLVMNLSDVGGTWKISDVTVLEGATPASEGSASGSTGSNVPGQ